MDSTMNLRRSGSILNRKFLKYLLPMIATAVATSLDEFVDSILVANLLGPEAMSLVNIVDPLMMIIATLYTLFGIGGSTLYAINIGERKTRQAGKIFFLSISAGLTAALILLVGGFVFLDQLCGFLCHDTDLRAQLPGYIQTLLISAPLIIGVQILSIFMPAAGAPNLCTALSMTANALNLVCDYVFLKYFHMGVEGAAWATFVGYIVCLLVLVVLLLCRKIKVHITVPSGKDVKILGSIVAQGAPNACAQFGYTVKCTFFNNLALSMGGALVLQVLTVCNQMFSIMSIGLVGILDTIDPLTATLKGQKDYTGIRYVIRFGFVCNIITTIGLVGLFEMFPQLLFRMFNVTNPAVIEMAAKGIRIFMITFLFRDIYIQLMVYLRISGHQLYSVIISLLDGFVLLVPVAFVTTALTDATGIWIAFPLTGILILSGCAGYNAILCARSKGRIVGFFLLEKDEEGVSLSEMTICETDTDITDMSQELVVFCREHGMTAFEAYKTGLIAEEMALYTRSHRKKSGQIDVIARITADSVTVDFRSEGTPFNPLARNADDVAENILLIQKIPDEVVYDYILGMNSTRYTIKR